MNFFAQEFQVRFYECDSLGHLNNAVYAQYLEETALQHSAAVGWPLSRYLEDGAFWILRRLTVEYLRPAFYGERLTVETWVSEMGHTTAHREYRVRRGDAELARARSLWTYFDLARQRPGRTPAAMREAVQPFGAPALADFESTGDPPFTDRTPRRFLNRRRVQRHELDPIRHVNNAVYFQWLEHAVAEALQEIDRSYAYLQASGSAIFQRRQAIEYLRPALEGDDICIATSLHGVRRVTGTWLQEVFREADGALLARSYNTGACVNLEGRPQRCPEEVIEILAPRG